MPDDTAGEGVVLVDDLFRVYRESVQGRGVVRATKEALGKILKAEFGVLKSRPRVSGSRAYEYRFPPLHECRARFDKRLAVPYAWDNAMVRSAPLKRSVKASRPLVRRGRRLRTSSLDRPHADGGRMMRNNEIVRLRGSDEMPEASCGRVSWTRSCGS